MHALEGIKILDLSMYLAGPYGPALLSDLGAEVVKVEPLQGEPLRAPTGAYLGWNHGKRCIAIDLTTPQGQEIVHKLARESDVVVENYRPLVAERLRVDYATLQALNPGIIYCSVTAYGPTGPYEHKPGVDPLLQARSGVMRAQGGRENPPIFLRIPVCDYTTAMLNACEIALALYHRARTGQGQRVETSLLNSGAFLSSDAFTAYPGRPERRLADAGLHGLGPLDRMYPTADGWIFLVCGNEQHWHLLCEALGRPDLPGDERFSSEAGRETHGSTLAGVLEELFQGRPAVEWVQLLEEAGVPCAPVEEQYAENLFTDVHALETGTIVQKSHAELGEIEQAGPLLHFSETPGLVGRAAPTLGQHTDDVLGELGYTPEAIAELRAMKVVG